MSKIVPHSHNESRIKMKPGTNIAGTSQMRVYERIRNNQCSYYALYQAIKALEQSGMVD